MKNVLIIPPFNPYPLVSGGHQAIFNGIAILEGVANVYVFVKTTESKHKRGEDRQIEKALPFAKILYYIDPASRHTFRWYWNVLRNKLESRIPIFRNRKESEKNIGDMKATLPGIYDIQDEEIDFVNKAIKRYKIDIVQVEMLPDIRIVDYIPAHIKKIFVQHEIKFVKDELFLQTLIDVPEELRKQYQKNKQEEIELHNKYDYVVTLSPIDTQKLKDNGVTAPIITSFAVVNPQANHIRSKVGATKVLSYVGPEAHYPNYDGIMWFLKNCWSRLQEKDSKYTLHIIGKWSQQTAEKFEVKYGGKVKCLGFVDDLAEALNGTTMIVPLNIGSGIRMKILEAAQLNVPVVTTPVGGEGLPLVDGENCFITDDPTAFVKDIIKLQDEKLREKFVAGIREEIANKYSLDALKENRKTLYEQ